MRKKRAGIPALSVFVLKKDPAWSAINRQAVILNEVQSGKPVYRSVRGTSLFFSLENNFIDPEKDQSADEIRNDCFRQRIERQERNAGVEYNAR